MDQSELRPARPGIDRRYPPAIPLGKLYCRQPRTEVAMQKSLNPIAWAMAAFIVYIYVWYLQYKFLGHPGSVELFTTLTDWLGLGGHEKLLRIGTGSMELVASILLVVPMTQAIGAAFSLGIITGALFFHLASPLGIDPYG